MSQRRSFLPPARRARLETKFSLTSGRARRWTAKYPVRLSTRLVRRPTVRLSSRRSPMPQRVPPSCVGAWGAAGTGDVSTPIVRSAARRARLGTKFSLTSGRARRWTAKYPVRLSTRLVRRPTVRLSSRRSPMPQRVAPIVGAWGAAGCGDVSTPIVPSARTPCPSGNEVFPDVGAGTALDGEVPCSVINTIGAPSNPMPQRVPPPIVGAWGAAGTGDVSTPIDRSAARRARLETKFSLTSGRARRWTAKEPVRLSTRLVRCPTPCPNGLRRLLGHGVRREPAMSQRRSIVPQHAVPVWKRSFP
jgi:hypothetical protein